jgi:hypothetical protein
MIKKILFAFAICFLLVLTGCDGQKIVTIESSQPEGLFLQTLSTLKKELPGTTIIFDVPALKVGYSDYKGNAYPSELEMIFTKNNNNTDVLISVKNADETKINNLQALLTKSIDNYKKTESEINNNEPAQQLRRIDMAK